MIDQLALEEEAARTVDRNTIRSNSSASAAWT